MSDYTDNNYPLVTIGMPTYNSQGRVLNALETVLSQDYPNLEIIVSDNASTDDTQELFKSVCQDNQCVRYHRQAENIGLMRNFDYLLKQANGEYFMWVSDDDELKPGILKEYVNFLDNHKDYSLVSGEIKYLKNGRTETVEGGFTLAEASPISRVLRYYFKVRHGALIHGLMRRADTSTVSFRNIMGGDWHFVAELAFKGKVKNFDYIGYTKRFGGTSRNFKAYARAIGASQFDGNFPFIRIAMDACSFIHLPVATYADTPLILRWPFGIAAFLSVFLSYYLKLHPLVLGGRVKRFFQRMVPTRWSHI